MKHTKALIAAILAVGLAFSASASVGIVKSELTKSTENAGINIVISSDQDVYGLQFDLLYNTDELKFVSGESLMEGYSFYFKEKENGVVRGILFSLQGDKLVEATGVANLVDIEFEPVPGFKGSSHVEFSNVILAGSHGEEILTSTSGFDVTFDDNVLPQVTSLSKNYPNPFNPVTQIPFMLSKPGFVTAVIYNINGAEVRTLASGYRDAGSYTLIWDGNNNEGVPVASGRYIMKVTAPGFSDSITMTLLK